MKARRAAPCPAGDMCPHVLLYSCQQVMSHTNRTFELCKGQSLPAEQVGSSAALALTTSFAQECPSAQTQCTSDIKAMSLQG